MDKTSPATSEDMGFGIHIPGYELQQEINRGGQAVIFMALQRSTGRKVAIKILLEGPLGSQVDRNRMEREARILASLDHPNIVSVIDRGETEEGWPYFVLEYVEGQIFAEYMDDIREKNQPLGIPQDLSHLLRLFARICDAVNAAHLRGIVHRDMKPDNIVIDPYGEPHVLDFGVAQAPLAWITEKDQLNPDTAAGEFLGSLQWASPEQVEGDGNNIDIRADVYALGIILYELLTSDVPYDVFCGIRQVLENIVEAKPIPPSIVLQARVEENKNNPIDAVLDAIVLKALAKDRNDRYQSAGELGREIIAYLDGKELGKKNKLKRRPILTFAVAGSVSLVLAGILFFGFTQYNQKQVLPQQTPFVDEDIFGYRLEAGEVIFEFDPRDYDVVRMGDNSLGKIADITYIDSASIAGTFNDWKHDSPTWIMQRVRRNLFTLRKPLKFFADRAQWSFKFVINGTIWISAPIGAKNKEVVAEDTATFNLLLINPSNTDDASAAVLRDYREQIDQRWYGQGAYLGLAKNGTYHFTLTHYKGSPIYTLKPLENIPLTSLNLGEVQINNYSALKNMTTLETLLCSDMAYWRLVNSVMTSVYKGDFSGAEAMANNIFSAYSDTPACTRFRDLVKQCVSSLESLAKQPTSIPANADMFQGHYYAPIITPMNWHSARQFAQRHGAQLACVTSTAEQEWLTATYGLASLGRRFWLGGTDELVEGNWGWLSQEPWGYENWTPPEPNDKDHVEHCLAMLPDGWWIDANGHDLKLPFILEWEN